MPVIRLGRAGTGAPSLGLGSEGQVARCPQSDLGWGSEGQAARCPRSGWAEQAPGRLRWVGAVHGPCSPGAPTSALTAAGIPGVPRRPSHPLSGCRPPPRGHQQAPGTAERGEGLGGSASWPTGQGGRGAVDSAPPHGQQPPGALLTAAAPTTSPGSPRSGPAAPAGSGSPAAASRLRAGASGDYKAREAVRGGPHPRPSSFSPPPLAAAAAGAPRVPTERRRHPARGYLCRWRSAWRSPGCGRSRRAAA